MSAFITPLSALTRRATTSISTSHCTRPRRTLSTTFTGLALLSAASILPSLTRSDATSSDTNRCTSTSTSTTRCSSVTETGSAMSLQDLCPLKDISGNEVGADKFAGKVVFAMNVASACGYTSSGYDLFKRLTDKYSADEFVAVAIPCNSFGWQESGTPEEIQAFALARADKLLVLERSEVNGDNAHPMVKLAKTQFPGRIGWNFDGRYVFDKDGKPIAKFGNSDSAEAVEKVIESVL